MRTNETKWKQWYLAATGKQWQDDVDEQPDLSQLSPKQAQIGAQLYRRYLSERAGADAQAFGLQSIDASAAKSKHDATLGAQLQRYYLPQKARKLGLQGSVGYAEQALEQVAQTERRQHQAAEQNADIAREKLTKYYTTGREKADKQLERDLQSVQKRYQSQEQSAWQSFKRQWQAQLKSPTSSNGAGYTTESVQAVRQQVLQNREALGDYYDRALQWADTLPVSDAKAVVTFEARDGTRYSLAGKDWQNADIVRALSGDATTAQGIFDVQYRDTRYTLRTDAPVSDKQNNMLDALAQSKRITPTKGTVLYVGGALYVYDGAERWYGTRSVDSAKGTDDATAGLAFALRNDLHG